MPDKIIKTILEDAQKIAVSTRNEGNVKAQEIISIMENEISQIKNKHYQKTLKMRDDIMKQELINANLEVKKKILAAKRKLLDSVFERAIEQIRKSKKTMYLELISALLNEAEEGDVVFISEMDSKIITPSFIEKESKSRKIKLRLEPKYIDIKGGILLSNVNYDKNLSLENLMASLKEDIETEVSKKLFKE